MDRKELKNKISYMLESEPEVFSKMLEKFIKLYTGTLTLSKAILVAVLGHANQQDKGKNEYIRHPLRVMEDMDSEDEMCIAVNHDLVEDTNFTLEDLQSLGFTNAQLKAIDLLTKKSDTDYEQYIEDLKKSVVASKVKVRDIHDNLKLWRLKNIRLSSRDVERMQKYIDALDKLGGLKP